MSITAFVPARCGSKAIRLKNIKLFFGRPLIYWCLKALQESSEVDQIVVATDCSEIESTVSGFNFKKVKIYHRHEDNAQDKSATEDVMLEYIVQASLPVEDFFLLVQATSPFTKAHDFDTAVDKLRSGSFDSLLSCTKVKRFLWNEDGTPLNYDHHQRPRRQDFSGTFLENGALYLNTVGNIINAKNRLSGKVDIYEMPSYTSLELDEEEDWVLGEQIMAKHHEYKSDPTPIRLFLSDVDGVLTDAGMYYTENGDEIKKFHTYDGMGFKLLQQQGVKVGILTKEDRELNRRRAKKLKLDYDFHGVDQKLELVQNLCQEMGITLKEVAYIGDDINDVELLRAAGIAACPQNARPEVKKIPGIILLKTPGGSGAVRELVEQFLLKWL